MSKYFVRAVYAGIVAVLCVSNLIAQSDREAAVAAAGDKYVISAKAGGVNYVEGAVAIVRKQGKSGYLTQRDEIEIGDRVSTGADGKAEILLNPGSYMRIGPNSAFEFNTTSLDDLRVRLDSGSAIFEVFAANEFKVTVIAPKAKLFLIESGVFRIDVNQAGGARIEVWEGKAQLGDVNATIVKEGRAADLSGRNSAVAKFDRGEKDEFELWSKSRAKLLAKNVARLKNRDMRNTLMRSFLGRGWNTFSSFGLWVWDPMFGGYCFLPFGYGWSSPYGYGFGSSLYYYDMPWIVYNPPPSSGGGTVGGSTPPANTPLVRQGDRDPVPPFVRMGGGSPPRGITDSGGNGSGNGPAYSPPVYVPAPAPPTTRDSSPSKKGDN